MRFKTVIRHRRSIRLPEFDYASVNYYFVTICTHEKECVFGEIENGEMKVNEIGGIVQEELMKTPVIRKEIELDEWVVMPNHVHFIISIHNYLVGAHGMRPDPCMIRSDYRVGIRTNRDTAHGNGMINGPGACHAPLRRQPKSIGGLIAGLKGAVTKRVRLELGYSDSIWHRNYYERVIRSECELFNVRQYIRDNPMKWNNDPEHAR